MDEEWRSVAGHPMYEVSNLGRVRCKAFTAKVTPSTYRPNLRERHIGSRVIQPTTRPDGALSVRMMQDQGTHMVCELVAEAFLGPAPPGMHAKHQDRDVTNNRLANLYYGYMGQGATRKGRTRL